MANFFDDTDWPTEFTKNRAPVLERFLDRAEPRARHLVDEITSTGDRLLARLAESEHTQTRAAG